MDNTRPTWAEIDLTAIKQNMSRIKKTVAPARVMAIVKANAYGHGMLEVAQVCLQEGAEFLGVASLDEGLTLRSSGIKAPILVLGFVPQEYAEPLVANNIRATVFDIDSARALSRAGEKLGKPAYVHIKVDTGMGRLGFFPDSAAVEAVETIFKMPNINLEGIFTHFAVADIKDKTYTLAQLDQFTRFISLLEKRGIKIPFKHCANSAAIMDIPQAGFDMVRAGIVLYGLYPSHQVNKERLPLVPAMTLKSKISLVKTLQPGQTVSYGRTYCCSKPTKVATVPVGYADGYSRLLSNRAWAVVRGQRIPLIGTVCMDQCMFDVSGVEEIKAGDEVILFGKPENGVTVDDLASLIGTINYEVVSMISSRVIRVYI